MRKATVALVFDQKKTQDPDRGIIKIRVTFQREKRFVTTGLKVSVSDWQKLDRMKGDLDNRMKNEDFIRLHQLLYGSTNTWQQSIEGLLTKARKVVEGLGAQFTFEHFKQGLATYGQQDKQLTEQNEVIRALTEKHNLMMAQDQISTASIYGLVVKSILRFVASLTDTERRLHGLPVSARQQAGPTAIRFEQVTPAFLNAYEAWMLREGKASQRPQGIPQPASITTVGMYCRHLRAVFNQALDQGIITSKVYPFGRNRYVIPAGRTPKKALSTADLTKIKQYEPLPDSGEEQAHDLWLFTYYSNGLNMADLCRIRWRDIDTKANCFYFVRQKTQRTKKGDTQLIRVQLRAETWRIIDRWSTSPRRPDAYIFPFLTGITDARREKMIVAQVVKRTNKWMGRIATKLGIEGKVNTYGARHSFATTLLRNGASVAMIGQQVGHASLRSTEHYLGQFEEDDVQQYLDRL